MPGSSLYVFAAPPEIFPRTLNRHSSRSFEVAASRLNSGNRQYARALLPKFGRDSESTALARSGRRWWVGETRGLEPRPPAIRSGNWLSLVPGVGLESTLSLREKGFRIPPRRTGRISPVCPPSDQPAGRRVSCCNLSPRSN